MNVYVVRTYCAYENADNQGMLMGVFSTREKAMRYCQATYNRWYNELTPDEQEAAGPRAVFEWLTTQFNPPSAWACTDDITRWVVNEAEIDKE